MVRPADRYSDTARPGLGGPARGSGVPVSSTATETADSAEEQSLAHDMIEVHGADAAVVARDNARTAALAGQRPQAKSWIRVLGIIQRRWTDKNTRPAEPDCRSLFLPTSSTAQG